VTFLDTAGLREGGDRVERIGISRALERAGQADLRIFLLDKGDVPLLAPRDDDLVVHGKADERPGPSLAVSGLTGQGIGDLIAAVTARLERRAASAGLMTRERHRNAALRAIGAMESARDELLHGSDRIELAAERLREAIRALDSLVGRVDVEDLLDEIFGSFCIGK
jgi:tRNA modification GTPase